MAIVSISRIQIRRGKKNAGSGLPQLAGGEFGWAVDSQELYLGNGSVSEGAPNVGNTKVLTEHDNLFQLSNQYIYLNGSTVQTGTTALNHTKRDLQSRLDDLVSARSFGITGDGTDVTDALQRAIDQIFCNPATVGNETSRVTLHLHAGVYVINGTLHLPPFTNIQGDGSDKTVIKQNGSFTTIVAVNGIRVPGDSSTHFAQTTTLNQPRHISIKGLTIEHTTSHAYFGMQLDNVTNSIFEDVKLKGPWTTGTAIQNGAEAGIKLTSLSSVVTSSNNNFNKFYIDGWSNGVISDNDIVNNTFTNSIFENLGYGVVWGRGTNLGNVAMATGPINNAITNSRFANIDKNGFWVKEGYGNVSANNSYALVGNDGGAENGPVSGVIKFESKNNSSHTDHFTRTKVLSSDTANLSNVAYIPEIEGKFAGTFSYTFDASVGYVPTTQRLFRLPADSNKKYKIDYTYLSNTVNATRHGELNVMLNIAQGTTKIADEYNYDGDVAYQTNLEFTTALSDENGDATKETLVFYVKNTTAGDNAGLLFHVSVLS